MIYTEKDLDEIYQQCLHYAKQQSHCDWDSAVPAYLQDLGQYQITEPDKRFSFLVHTDIFHDACGELGALLMNNGKLIEVTVTTDY